ncbi:MAG: hypothetical protein NWQ38_08015 [Cellulophaga sp.]|nr:hypothetical protein [Cellulophaga sp.]
MKKIITLFFLIASVSIFAQEELNNYKYIIVPKQFDAFKEMNQYQTSTLVKYILENQGFNVFYDDDLPSELSANRCLGLLTVLVNGSNMFTTKTAIAFKDCNSKIVYTTAEGTSKIKEYKGAYNEAIKETLNGLNYFKYKYAEQSSEPVVVSFKNDVKNITPKVEQTATVENKAVEVVENTNNKKNEVVALKPAAVPLKSDKTPEQVFYAQSIENGYQLVDSTPKIVMKMFSTSKPNMYLAEDSTKNSGMVYTENGEWFFEYYEAGKLIKKNLSIKF